MNTFRPLLICLVLISSLIQLPQAIAANLSQSEDSFTFKFVNAHLSDDYEKNFFKLTSEAHDPQYEVSGDKIRILALVKPDVTSSSHLKFASALAVDILTGLSSAGGSTATQFASGVKGNAKVKHHIKSLDLQNQEGKLICKPLQQKQFFVNDNFIDFYGMAKFYHAREINEPYAVMAFDFAANCFEHPSLQMLIKTEEKPNESNIYEIKNKILQQLK